MMRVLLTGATGQVGWELRHTLAPLGELIIPGRSEFDLAQPRTLRAKIRDWRPDIIVNPAAYTAVDEAEKEAELAFTINAEAPRILAEEADRLRIPLVHYSTDYVFDGAKRTPYTEDDSPNPINVYGESKLKGEQLIQQNCEYHLIMRTSWVYSLRGKNFLTTIRRLLRERDEISVVNDQVGSPTWSRMVAEATSIILGRHKHSEMTYWGIYHLSAEGETNWHEFARAIWEMEGYEKPLKLIPIPSTEFPSRAKRPMYSGMNGGLIHKHLGIQLPSWQHSLELLMG